MVFLSAKDMALHWMSICLFIGKPYGFLVAQPMVRHFLAEPVATAFGPSLAERMAPYLQRIWLITGRVSGSLLAEHIVVY